MKLAPRSSLVKRSPRQPYRIPRLEWLERRIAPAGFDTLGTAIMPVFDAALQAHDTRTLVTANTVDLYAVTLKAGDAIVADAITTQMAGSPMPALRVFDKNGAPLTPLDSQAGPNPELSYAATADGTYYVGVSSVGNLGYDPTITASGGRGASTTFTLDLTRLPAVAEQEPSNATGQNDTPKTAESLQTGTNLSGNLPPGDVDFYRFTVADSGRLRVALTATNARVLDPRLQLLDASGQLLIQSDQHTPGDPTASLDQHLQAGTYVLEVSAVTNAIGSATDRGYDLMTRFDTALPPFTSLPVGANPESVVVEDLNGDGTPDLVTANKDYDSVSVLLGKGDGTFQRAQFFDVGTSPICVAVGDVNGDGIPDLLTANFDSNDVSVLLGNGDGTFQAAQTFKVGTGPESVALADVTRDGHLDIVTANFTSNTVSVLLGNGKGGFGPAQSFTVGTGPTSVAVADLNGDRNPDIVTANFTSNNASVLLGDGQGGFHYLDNNPARGTFAVGTGPEAVTVADLAGNGRLDLITANQNSNTVSVLLGNGDGTFKTAKSIAVGNGPQSVAVADLNGDGIPDLITANLHSYDVSVLLGNGDGTFKAAQAYHVGESPFFVAVADVNGDGRPDLVTTNRYSSDVSVLLGNGDGTFQKTQSLAAGTDPVAVTVADLNGDDRPDLVVVNRFSNDVSVLLGNGDGTFGKAQPYAVGQSPDSVVVADLNGDGRPDLIVANANSRSVSVLLGNGDGTFRPAQSFTVGSRPFSVAVADLNGDGIPDIVTANYGNGTVGILLGKGDGTFGTAHTYTVGNGAFSVAVGALNRDGRPDIVTANNLSNTVSVLLNEGNGTFGTAHSYGVLGMLPEAVAILPLEGDGSPAIVTANYNSSNVSVLLNNGNGSFGTAKTYATGTKPFGMTIAKLNGDTNFDILTANTADNDVSVLQGNGDGTFQPMSTFAVGSRPFSVAVADVNGDGRPDIVTANIGGNDVSILLGQRNGTFQKTQSFTVASTSYSNPSPYAAVIQDVSGDGIPDLITANQNTNNVSLLLGNKGGTFQAPQFFSVGTSPQSVAVADLEGDGIFDIVTANYGDNTVSVLMGDGHGNFTPGQTIGLGTGAGPQFVTLEDVNGDGSPDLIVAEDGSDNVAVLLGQGNGTFTLKQTISVGGSPKSVAVADIDGDGIPDIVAANYDDGTVSLLKGKGDGTFQTVQTISVGNDTGPRSVVVADLEKNGKPDIVVANAGNNSVSVLRGDGHGNFIAGQTTTVGKTPYSVAVADLNGDGLPDLITANKDDNDVSILYGNGDGTFRKPQVASVGTSPYSVAVADLTGDGRSDIVTANQGSNDVSVLLLPKIDAFEPVQGASSIPTRDIPQMADITGNGIADVLSLTEAGQLLFRRGTTDPQNPVAPFIVVNPNIPARGFAIVESSGLPEIAALDRNDNAVTLYVWSPALQTFQDIGSVATGHNPVRIASADLNGDGRGDLVIGNDLDDTVTIAFHLPSGQFDPNTLTRLVGDGPSSITFANVSGFGNDIVVSGQVSGDVTILYNDAGNTFATESRYRAGLGLFDTVQGPTGSTILSNQQTVGAVVADFFDKGYPGIVTLNRLTDNFTLLRNTGDGSFVDPQASDVYSLGATPVQALTGDFLGNGRQDLAVLTTVADGSSQVLVYLANPDGTFAAPIINVAGAGATGFSFLSGNGAGPDRLLIGNAYGDFLTLKGDGKGHFTVDRGNLDGKPLAVGQTSDGRHYVVVADQSEDRVSVYFRVPGSNAFDAPISLDSSVADKTLLAPGAVQLVDLNNNGIDDLVVASRLGNDILIYTGLGNGQFAPKPASYPVGFEPVSFTAAYLEGDGVLDLAVVNQGSNDLSILKGSIDPTTGLWKGTAGARLSSGGSEPISVEASDFNGDGIPDLRATNRGGQVFTMLGIGSNRQGTGFFRDNLGIPVTLPGGGIITDEVSDPLTDREFVLSGGQISVFNGTTFTTFVTSGPVDTLGVADGFLVAGFADGSVGLMSEEGDLLKQSVSFGDQPSALEALQDGNSIDVYLTLDGSQVPVFVSLLIPVVTQLPNGGLVASPTSLPGADLVLVATLLTGGLEEGTSPATEIAVGEASFLLFLPPVKVSVPQAVGPAVEEDVTVTLVVNADPDGMPLTEEFKGLIKEALEQRLMKMQVGDTVEDLVETIKSVLDQFRAMPKEKEAEPPAGFEDGFEHVALDRVAEAMVHRAEEVAAPFVRAEAQWLEGESLWSLQSAFLVSWLCSNTEPVEDRRRLAQGWVDR